MRTEETAENSSSAPWLDNDSDNTSDYKSKSTAIPAISLIKDFFGNHEKNEELEDINLANSSHQDWLQVEESFQYNNFSLSHPNSVIKSPFLVDTAYTTTESSKKSDDSQDVEDKGGGGDGGGGGGGVSSAVYAAVHDAVTNLLSNNNDIEADLVSKLHHLLGRKSFCRVDGQTFISISFL